MESMEMWKIKNFPHFHPFHKLYYRKGTAILKKILFFIFTGNDGRRTKDERRGTQDERRRTNGRTRQASNRKQAENTHRIMHKKRAVEIVQNESFV